MKGGRFMDERNQKDQEKSERNCQKKQLIQMKKEIESLKSEIYSSLTNTKIKTIRNLKVTARALQLVAPYVITAGVVTGYYTLIGEIPFYPDDKKSYSNVMTEFDSTGNIRYEQQYGDFENSDNKLYYYSKWEKNDEGLYSRMVQSYSINEKTYKTIVEAFTREDLKLEDVLGKPDSKMKETKNNVTEEELKEKPFIKVAIYNKDENDYIIVKENFEEDAMYSNLYVLTMVAAEVIPYVYRKKYSRFNFSDCINKIKREYRSSDIDNMIKKIRTKKI